VSTPLRGSGIFFSVSVAFIVGLLMLWGPFPAAVRQPRRHSSIAMRIRRELTAALASAGDACVQVTGQPADGHVRGPPCRGHDIASSVEVLVTLAVERIPDARRLRFGGV